MVPHDISTDQSADVSAANLINFFLMANVLDMTPAIEKVKSSNIVKRNNYVKTNIIKRIPVQFQDLTSVWQPCKCKGLNSEATAS